MGAGVESGRQEAESGEENAESEGPIGPFSLRTLPFAFCLPVFRIVPIAAAQSIVRTTFPVRLPAPWRVFSSRNRSACAASARGNVRPT